MRIIDILRTRRPVFSFEFFPPKSLEDEEALFATARTLQELDPDFISVTWGAGGGTRRKTIEITSTIRAELGIESMSHLTCVGASRAELDEIVDEIGLHGIENIMVLRGDPPKGETTFVPHPAGYLHADELVRRIRSRQDFCIGVGGYPEVHPEATDADTDLEHLRRKVDAGADFITTQLFFETDLYFRFVDRVRRAGVEVPVLPGIMPVTNVRQIKRFTNTCGATIPGRMLETLDRLQDDAEGVIRYGIEFATRQCEELLAGGAPAIHFYTLNRSRSAAEILGNLKNRKPTHSR